MISSDGKFLTKVGKKLAMLGSLPNPGPTTQMFIALLQAIILLIHIYGTWLTPEGSRQDY